MTPTRRGGGRRRRRRVRRRITSTCCAHCRTTSPSPGPAAWCSVPSPSPSPAADLLLGDVDGARAVAGPGGADRLDDGLDTVAGQRRRASVAGSDRAPIRLQPARRTISVMEPTADVRFYLQIHAKLRADSARYVASVEQAVETERTRRSALRRWAEGFVDELLEHHHAEDDHLFPDLAARVPASRMVLARLDADHRLLDDVLERWVPPHATSAGRTGPSPRPARRCSHLDRARDHLACGGRTRRRHAKLVAATSPACPSQPPWRRDALRSLARAGRPGTSPRRHPRGTTNA